VYIQHILGPLELKSQNNGRWATAYQFITEGDKRNPDNYRGISQSSNLGKVLWGILNNRITQFIQHNNIINSSRISFSQNNRPTVHIYTSHTLIEKPVQNVKKVKYLVVS